MTSRSPLTSHPPDTLIRGKYRLLRRIGEGSMGVVWAAFNEATSREVALKLLVRPDAEMRERLLREARACGAVQHRNVVDIYDADVIESGDPFLVMPLLTGETLAALLRRRRRLEPREAARIARDIASGLSAAHALGIIHRDLKPSNIFLHTASGESDYVVKILDFGVSKMLTRPLDSQTIAGMLVGSPPYMSPEQVRARGDIDHRVDLWTLGVVLFEMLSGSRLIQGSAPEVLLQVVEGDFPSIAALAQQIDPALVAVISSCLERDRERRPRSAADVVAALEPFASSAAHAAQERTSALDLRPVAPAAPSPDAADLSETVQMSAPAPWSLTDAMTTVPRGPGLAEHPLGQFGTIKMSSDEALVHRAKLPGSPAPAALFAAHPPAQAAPRTALATPVPQRFSTPVPQRFSTPVPQRFSTPAPPGRPAALSHPSPLLEALEPETIKRVSPWMASSGRHRGALAAVLVTVVLTAALGAVVAYLLRGRAGSPPAHVGEAGRVTPRARVT